MAHSVLEFRDLLQNAVNHARDPNPWDIGNSVLYKLCQEHPLHEEEQAVLAKVWLIGRAYAAAIERRRPRKEKDAYIKEENDVFYHKVVGEIKKSPIDKWISKIKKEHNEPTIKSLNDILSVHANVTKLFTDISGLQKRSLASKFLHFHVPELFYIYDSRAVKVMNRLASILSFEKNPTTVDTHDPEYSKFAEKCLHLQTYIEKEFKVLLTPRQIDNLLLNIECTINNASNESSAGLRLRITPHF